MQNGHVESFNGKLRDECLMSVGSAICRCAAEIAAGVAITISLSA